LKKIIAESLEIDEGLADTIAQTLSDKEGFIDDIIRQRLARHVEFVGAKGEGAFGYVNEVYGFPVKTKSETSIKLSSHVYQTCYEGITQPK